MDNIDFASLYGNNFLNEMFCKFVSMRVHTATLSGERFHLLDPFIFSILVTSGKGVVHCMLTLTTSNFRSTS